MSNGINKVGERNTGQTDPGNRDAALDTNISNRYSLRWFF
jgi:hypothetical protein